jgi:hypothetical protein
MKLNLTIISLLTILTVQLAGADTLTVTSTDDSGPGTLRDALANAEDGDSIDATGVSGTILLTSGELFVDKSVDILGPGSSNLAVDGNAASRVFDVSPGTVVTIDGCTITNGAANGAFPADAGGGIYNDGATLTISRCSLSANSATGGGGIFNNGGYGSASLMIIDCQINSNSVGEFGGGGGIANYALLGAATLYISNSTVNGNSAGYEAGGIDTYGYGGVSTVTVINSTISSNSVVLYGGGGIYNEGEVGTAILLMTNSTLSGNSAGGNGGGISNDGGYGGNVTMQAIGCTLSGNSAGGRGGAVFNYGYYGSAQVTMANTTLSGNPGVIGGSFFNDGEGGTATLKLGSTILNAGPQGVNLTNFFATVVSLGYNLSSDDYGGFLTNSTDQINIDPMLGPLQDNGGPTFTHGLLCGSPAIDKGKNFSGSPFDQRGPGLVRTFDDPHVPNAPGGDGTDIGAFEVQASCNQPPVARCRDVTVSADSSCTASASIDDGSFDPDGYPITVTQSPPGPYPVGTNIVTLTVTDNRGGSNSCTATITVKDEAEPSITCPDDITVTAKAANGATVSFTPLGDSCSGPPLIESSPASGSTFPIGITTVTCKATDRGNGNYVLCQFHVTVLGPRQMLQRLLDTINSRCSRPQPLVASVDAAISSLDRNDKASAINQLHAFQSKVRSQVAPTDPQLAVALSQAAQDVINVLSGL